MKNYGFKIEPEIRKNQSEHQLGMLIDTAIILGKNHYVHLDHNLFSEDLLSLLLDVGVFKGFNDYQFLIDMLNKDENNRSSNEDIKINRIIKQQIYPYLRQLYKESWHPKL